MLSRHCICGVIRFRNKFCISPWTPAISFTANNGVRRGRKGTEKEKSERRWAKRAAGKLWCFRLEIIYRLVLWVANVAGTPATDIAKGLNSLWSPSKERGEYLSRGYGCSEAHLFQSMPGKRRPKKEPILSPFRIIPVSSVWFRQRYLDLLYVAWAESAGGLTCWKIGGDLKTSNKCWFGNYSIIVIIIHDSGLVSNRRTGNKIMGKFYLIRRQKIIWSNESFERFCYLYFYSEHNLRKVNSFYVKITKSVLNNCLV